MTEVALDLDLNDNQGKNYKFAMTGKSFAAVRDLNPALLAKVIIFHFIFIIAAFKQIR